jgi:hypothetical protein
VSRRRADALLRGRLGRSSGLLVGVYRARNAARVRVLVDAVRSAGWGSAWWALDDVAPSLADGTVGRGAGTKFALLNGILEGTPSDTWLVVTDDDLEFVHGSPVELVAACEAAGFGLAQPAHVASSKASHEVTLARALAIARLTNFVEIGPAFAVAPEWRCAIVPFTELDGMGWGLELEWAELVERGCRLGIVDSVALRHTGAVGAEYDVERESELLADRLRARGIDHWPSSQRTLATWRPWQRTPPWLEPGT